MGTGADTTIIRYQTGGYPTTTSEGSAGYSGSGTSATVSSLTPGTTYYFSAWSSKSDGGFTQESASFSQNFTTTPETCSSGPNFTTYGHTQDVGSAVWVDPQNIQAADTNYASSTIPMFSNYLVATDFDFSIPDTAIIEGIKVTVRRVASSGAGYNGIWDRFLYLTKDGTSDTGSNRANSASVWSIDWVTATYGGSSDLWGTTWTPAEINSDNFGFRLHIYNNYGTPLMAYVDYITITVYHTCTDGTDPTVVLSSTASDPTNTSPIPMTATFDEDVTGFEITDITVGNGTASNLSGGPAGYTFDVTPTADGSVTVDIAAGVAQDAASNGNTAATQFSIVYDGTAPSVTISLASGQIDPAYSPSKINFEIAFNEAVTGFTASDITLGGTALGTLTKNLTGGPTTWNVEIDGMTSWGTVTASIAADACTDLAGNNNNASNTASVTYIWTTSLDVTATKTQYSDKTTLTATVVPEYMGVETNSGEVQFSIDGTLVGSPVTVVGGKATLDWTIDKAAGTYTVLAEFTSDNTDHFTDTTETCNLEVTTENATGDLKSEVAWKTAPGEDYTDPLVLTVWVMETLNPITHKEPNGEPLVGLGDISMAEIGTPTLEPVTGTPISGTVTSIGVKVGTGYGSYIPVTITFAPDIPVNTYTLFVPITGDYYRGTYESVIVIYDPTLGFTTGGGFFYWPGTQDLDSGYPGDKTNFGYTMKYNKKGVNVQGSMVIIRHMPNGDIYRIKSNALYGLALNIETGIASFSGKCTYFYPVEGSDPVNVGGQEFMVWVQDNNDPGDGIDQIWFTVLGQTFSLDSNENNKADIVERQYIDGGNIVVPHTPASNPDPSLNFNTGLTSDGTPLSGTLDTGFTIEINGGEGMHVLELVTTSADPELEDGNYSFYLKANKKQRNTLTSYFDAKTGDWDTQAWLEQIGKEIDGSEPYFYLKADGGTYSLVDNFKRTVLGYDDLTAVLTIDDDYPEGSYSYTGTLIGNNGVTLKVTVTLNVVWVS